MSGGYQVLFQEIVSFANHYFSRNRQNVVFKDLTSSQIAALGALKDTTAVSMKQLAETLGVTPGAVTKVVDHLEEKELVFRKTSPTDRRTVLLGITPAGQNTLSQLMFAFEQHLVSQFSEMPTEHLNNLHFFLQKLNQALGSWQRRSVSEVETVDPQHEDRLNGKNFPLQGDLARSQGELA